ncbi:MAG TPA: non-ribosomal peptide synthetase [Chthoniobacteraceae bacterium]|jgi:amino acid adenylation domain-containing protein
MTFPPRSQLEEAAVEPSAQRPPEEGAPLPLHLRFEAQAARSPYAAALILADEELSYASLNQRANQLADFLREQGVASESAVGVSLPRSFSQIVAVLAILKAGAGYVPLDPALPAARRSQMIADAGIGLVLTAELLEAESPRLSLRPDANSSADSSADSLVYITFTSGSTGRPKGIAMTQRPLLNLLDWMISRSASAPGARTLQFASLAFDVSFQEIFSTLLSGGTLVLLQEAERHDLPQLASVLERHRVRRIFLPAVALQQLAEGFNSGRNSCPELREVVTAGDQLVITPALREMFSCLPNCQLRNEYGPSETHVVTAHDLTGSPASWPELPPIGRPISRTSIHLLDPNGDPVPVGEIGELHVGGVSLARGYVGRDELTTEKFLPHPQRPGERLYRTGDLARELPDGSFEFAGRIDDQIKIRGHRVEPTDIEMALQQHPEVRAAYVLAREFAPGDRRLVAYVLADSSSAPTSGELHAFLMEKLPDYLVPSAFVLLEKLPLNLNGKIDRAALPAPSRARPEIAVAFTAPQTPEQHAVAALWCELLRLDSVGIHDNFFELGGNSLLLVQLHQRLRQQVDPELALTSLFQHPTIDSLLRFDTNAGAAAQQQAVSDRAARQREANTRQRALATARSR